MENSEYQLSSDNITSHLQLIYQLPANTPHLNTQFYLYDYPSVTYNKLLTFHQSSKNTKHNSSHWIMSNRLFVNLI